jgi:hypothetical protein
VNSGDLTELIEKSRQLVQSTQKKINGENFSVDWA